MAKFNHIVRNVPNTPENRQQIKDINKMSSESDSKWRLHIKYRQPKNGKQWGWGGSLRCEDADGFSVYMKNIIPWSEREEVVQNREMTTKYYRLLNKYNQVIMGRIVDQLKEDVDSHDLCSNDWGAVKRHLECLMNNIKDGFRELEG